MSDTNRNRFLSGRSGMLRSDMPGEAPSSDAMKISGRTFGDLVKMSAEFAQSVIFYDDENRPDGDWTAFFSTIYDYGEHKVRTDVIEEMMDNSSVEPHLALLFAFYRMLLIAQEDINTLTGRQMEYWFREVLGFGKKPHSEGTVTVFAELGRNAASVSIPKGTLFDAGKDASGNKICYRSVNELRLGTEKVEMVAGWSDAGGFTVMEPQNLPALHAFCISCPIFGMSGAVMTIKVTAAGGEQVAALEGLPVEYTSENGWETAGIYSAEKGVTIEKEKPSPVKYDPTLHGEGFDADTPLVRFVSADGLGRLGDISPDEISEITVITEDAEPLRTENKYGPVENRAGVNPFGPDGKDGDSVNVILPYPARYDNLEIEFLINESGVMREKRYGSRNGAIIRPSTVTSVSYALSGNRCDQEALSREYTRAVLKLMKVESPSDEDIEKILAAGVTAKFPKLLEPVRVKYAEYSSKSVKTFFQNPLGVASVTGDSTVDNQFRAGEGNSVLYIGVSGASSEKGQISLYMEVSGDSPEPAGLSWSYLEKEKWVSFGSSGVLEDTTCGLSQDGTVILDVSTPLENGSGLFLSGLAWIRAVADNGNCLNVKRAVSHAITVEYSPESAGKGPMGEILPQGSITRPVISIPGLKAVSQPFDGKAGVRAESDAIYRRRVAGNLRHKGRTWSVWDYESIVLEKFGEVAYVKCLPCVNSAGESSPGAVTVCIIPVGQESSLTPSAGTSLINSVRDAVRAVASPFAGIEVVSPSYTEIEVNTEIILRKGFNDAIKYQAYISDVLKDYLRPWVGSGTDGAHISDGDGISNIIAFLESVPCVDVVTSIQVFVGGRQIDGKERIGTGNPLEILTSASGHTIKCKTSSKAYE